MFCLFRMKNASLSQHLRNGTPKFAVSGIGYPVSKMIGPLSLDCVRASLTNLLPLE